ncbi:MAG: NAD(P)-dependent oxidoreductase [Dehalococcoidales bacterium]|nr:NAD(P)-dependent oxidoreductase [Dehalococcoidales bacterium]
MTKVLVTGGLGFIGSNLVPELRRRDYEVWVCDRQHSEGPNSIRCDVAQYRQLERLFDEHNFDYVYHLAAEYGRWNGEEYYENLWQTNVVGTKNILRLQEKKRFRLIFFSSAEVYGDYDGFMSEDIMDKVPIKQMNDYAMTKWVGELQVLNSAAMFGTETVRVRPVNAYGPHEHYSSYRGVIPNFIYKALKGEPYTVYLGHQRTFDYVEDTCRTFANIVGNFKPGEVYNVGGKEEWEHDIKYVSDLILKNLGKNDARVTYKEAEPFTTRVKHMDFSKIRRDLKHNPQVPLEEGIPRTIEWMKKAYSF